MSVTYYKRYRMERECGAFFGDSAHPASLPMISLPVGYTWVPWNPSLWAAHALVLYRSFVDELDSRLFPCLGEVAGCEHVMREIVSRFGFVPEATWLVSDGNRYVGTIQGLLESRLGLIQNVGVVPEARGLGLGSALLVQAMQGFYARGAVKVSLEVTAVNAPAIKVYRRVGFRRVRTTFKGAETAYSGW